MLVTFPPDPEDTGSLDMNDLKTMEKHKDVKVNLLLCSAHRLCEGSAV